jgi:predicted dienelactone hydrolase
MVGHSLGGYTAFTIAGGIPDFSKHPSLCLPEAIKKWYLGLRGFENHFYDDRIKAIVALAPGLGLLFDKEALSRVKLPVFIMEAEQDEVTPGPHNALLYRKNLPRPPRYSVLKGACHFAFLPLCNTDYVKKAAPETCYDPAIPREKLHIKIRQQILHFFDEALNLQ